MGPSSSIARRVGEFAVRLAAVGGVRLAQDNAIWKPPSGRLAVPSGCGVLGSLRSAEHDNLLDGARRYGGRYGDDLLRARFARVAHAPLGGEFHAPDDWLAHVASSMPAGVELELVPIEVQAGGRRSTMGGRFTAVPESASGRPATIDHQPHDLHRHAVDPRSSSSDLLALPAAQRDRARRGVLPEPVARWVQGQVADGIRIGGSSRLERQSVTMAQGLRAGDG